MPLLPTGSPADPVVPTVDSPARDDLTGNPDPEAALDALADAIDSRQFTVTRMPAAGRLHRIRVISRASGRLADDIYAGRGCFWWSWSERIGPVTDPAGAAAKIARVLYSPSTTGEPR